MTASPGPEPGRVHRKLITRHAEDAAFYWARRMEGSLAPQHDLRSLGRFEFLLQANLEGLRVAQHESSHFDARGQMLQPGSAGWDASLRRVKLWKTADETFVAAVLALEGSGSLPLLEEMACDQFDDAAGSIVTPMGRGLASAAAWLPWDTVAPTVLAWAGSPEPLLRRCALSALALHRLPAEGALARWLGDPHPRVRERALRAAGELGRADLAPALVSVLDTPGSDDDAGCRTAAVASLCLLGHARGVEAGAAPGASARTGALDMPGALHASVLPAWAQVAPPELLSQAIESALRQRQHWRGALAAMRFSGQARWLDVLIQMMEHQCGAEPVAGFFTEPASNLARQAADVFAHITGARIGDQLWRPAPEPEDDAEDAPSDPRIPAARKQDPDDGLLWPDVDAVKQWWGQQRSRLAAASAHQGRCLAGLPLSTDRAVDQAATVLVGPTATQLQRQHAALHLRCAGHTAQLFDVRAALHSQRARAAAMGLVMA